MVVIDAPPVRDTRRVSAAVAAAGVSSFALLYVPQPLLPQLAAAFRLDPGSASLAIGVATGALAVAVLPVAWLAGRVGRRRVILWSVVLSAVIGLLLPLAPSFPVLLVMRAVQGVAIAGFAGVAAAYLADAVGTARLTGAVGAMIAGNSVGGMLGRLGAGFAAEPMGWHGALLVVAGVSTLCALFTALTLPRTTGRPHGTQSRDPNAPDLDTTRPTHSSEHDADAEGRSHAPKHDIDAMHPTHPAKRDIDAMRRSYAPEHAADAEGRQHPLKRDIDAVHRTHPAKRDADAMGRSHPARHEVDATTSQVRGRAPEAGASGRQVSGSDGGEAAARRTAGLVAPFAVGALAMGAFVALYNAVGFRLTAPPLDLTPAAASLVFLAYAMGTASSAAAGRVAGRLGRTKALVAALLVTAAGSVLTVHPSLPLVAAGFAVLTAGFFAAHAIANAWVTAEAAPRVRGRAAGVYTLCYYLGSGVGGTAGSVVYGHAGWTWLIALTSAWLLLAVAAVLLTGRSVIPRRVTAPATVLHR
ncbi:MFS transporter [Nonomuraea phyllanthi]|uniref:MFS transporter n=1 Tax=Nonomuraea phyllanthi TaxID=2219224 RepID=UPI001D147EC0|nr:MFS transporter [Nonomuraea phyllanthi]